MKNLLVTIILAGLVLSGCSSTTPAEGPSALDTADSREAPAVEEVSKTDKALDDEALVCRVLVSNWKKASPSDIEAQHELSRERGFRGGEVVASSAYKVLEENAMLAQMTFDAASRDETFDPDLRENMRLFSMYWRLARDKGKDYMMLTRKPQSNVASDPSIIMVNGYLNDATLAQIAGLARCSQLVGG